MSTSNVSPLQAFREETMEWSHEKIRKGDKSKMIATTEELDAAGVHYTRRDYCAHLWIPLKKCRLEHFIMPWACKHERHIYEKCEYDRFQERLRDIESWRQDTLRSVAESVADEGNSDM